MFRRYRREKTRLELARRIRAELNAAPDPMRRQGLRDALAVLNDWADGK